MDPVVKVLAEELELYLLLEVLVCGRYNPDVDVDDLFTPNGTDLFLLDHAQYFGLYGQGHVPYLVEKDGAAVRLQEQPPCLAYGAAEGAFFMAKEVALQECLRQGRTVYCHKRLFLAVAGKVDRLGDKVLARAAFPEE